MKAEYQERAQILLKATLDILKKCDETPYLLDVLSQTSVWDGSECDGYCLMEEIGSLIEELEIKEGEK